MAARRVRRSDHLRRGEYRQLCSFRTAAEHAFCAIDDASSEYTMEQYALHREFCALFEKLLHKRVDDLGVDPGAFLSAATRQYVREKESRSAAVASVEGLRRVVEDAAAEEVVDVVRHVVDFRVWARAMTARASIGALGVRWLINKKSRRGSAVHILVWYHHHHQRSLSLRPVAAAGSTKKYSLCRRRSSPLPLPREAAPLSRRVKSRAVGGLRPRRPPRPGVGLGAILTEHSRKMSGPGIKSS